MYTNQKPTDGLAVLTTIDPVSTGATVTGSWVPAAYFHAFLALIDVGVFGASATVDFKVRQAQDSSGTGAKDITGKAITQLVAAGGNNRQAMINVRSDDLDTNNGFGFINISATVGTAASLISAALLGVFPHVQPPVDASASPAVNFGASSVAQIV
jgi:hypothetical protein